MKKGLFNFLLLVAMVIPIPIVAQNYGHHIVADGGVSNNYAPVAGRFVNYPQKTQSVYPASMLADLQDGIITHLRYYVAVQPTSDWPCTFVVKMGTTPNTTMTGWINASSLTTVFTGQVDATDTVMSIELDVPYTYTGGNLVVEFSNTTTASSMGNNTSFYSMAQTAGSWYSQQLTGMPNGRVLNFLPKVDFFCEEISCPKVSEISIDEVLGTTASISWNSVTGALGYLVSLNGGEEDMVSDTTYTFTDLESITTYNCAIRVLCSNGDTSGSRSASFTTPCGAFPLPLTEGFEASTNLPDCWTILYDYNEGGTHGISVGHSSAYAGSNCLSMRAQWNNTKALALATPLIAQPVNTVDVLFYAAGEYSPAPTVMAFNDLEVGYVKSLESGSPFYHVQTITFSQENVYNLYEVSFAGVDDTDSNLYVVFRRAGDNNVRPVWLDDVFIRTANPCSNPQSFSYHSTDSGEVSFVWADSINVEWEIAYGPAGTDPDSMERAEMYISSQPYTITGLSNDTTYDFYFRAICGDTYSYWIEPVTARPNSINMAKNGVDTVTSCGVTILDNGGGAGNYTSGCNSTLVIFPNDETEAVRLTGNYATEATYDYITLYDGVGVEGPSLGTYSGTGVIDTVSSVGPMTLYFYSDGATQAAGFQLSVSCEPRSTCVPPYNPAVSNVAVSNALVSWDFNPAFPAPDHYSIALTNQATGAVSYLSAPQSPYTLLSLQPATSYSVVVTAICVSGDSSSSPAVSFTTRGLPCAGPDVTQQLLDSLYNGSVSSIYLPSWSVFNYGLTQQVFRNDEMGDLSRITGLKFKSAQGSSTRSLNFYLGHTSLNSLNEFIIPADMTLVASGPYLFGENREIEITFDTPFDYNGSDNLILTILDNTGSSHAGNYTYVTSIAPNTSVYAGSNDSPFNILNPSATVSTTPQRMNVIWSGNPCSGPSSCVPPSVTATDIVSNAVTLSWLPGYLEDAWKVEYKETLDEDWNTFVASTNATTVTVTGLMPVTSYIFRVTSLCEDQASASSSVTLSTPCGAYPLPFAENFDNGFVASSTLFQPCWNRISTYPYGTYPNLSGTYTESGSSSLYFYSTEAYQSVAVLPMLDAPTDSLVVSFSAYKSGAGHDIKVGVMTDPNDFSTFTLVATVSPSSVNTWESFEVPLTDYQGSGRYVALACYDKVSYLYVDNLYVDTYLPCPRVSGITLDSASLTSAALHWNASASSYQVQYGPYGFSLGEGTIVEVSDTSIELGGLSNSLRYDVYVRGNCGADGYGHWSFPTTIATSCGTLDAIPYYENFDTWMSLSALVPMCWNNGGSFGPYLATTYDYYDAGASLYFSCSNSLPSAYVMLPEMIDSIDISQLELNFAVRGSSGTLKIGFCENLGDTSDFELVATLPVSSSSSWSDRLVSLANYNGSGRCLTFIFAKGSGANATFYLDELSIEPRTACLRPTNLSASNATDQSVTLSWNDPAGANRWEIAYCPANLQINNLSSQQLNNPAIQHAIANSNPFTLTGLTPSTVYKFWVRALCGEGDSGYYSNRAGQFTTAQPLAAVPYSYDFEEVDEWNQWQTGSNVPQVTWRRGRAAAASGSHAAYISSDYGASPSTMANVVAFAYRDFDFGTIDTNFTLSFKAQVSDNGSQVLNFFVFLTDPGVAVTTPGSYYNTPWGMVEDISPAVAVSPSSDWQEYAVELPHLSGVRRLVICYNNGSVTAGFSSPAQLDDLDIRYTTCPRPDDLEVNNIATSSATASWNGAASDYFVTLERLDNGVRHEYRCAAPTLTLYDLEPGTRYGLTVVKVCQPGDTSLVSPMATFQTDCLSEAVSLFPWVEDFENGLSCWQQEMRHGNNPWVTAAYYENVGHMAPSGSNIAYLDNRVAGDSTMLISPLLAISNGSTLAFSHMHRAWSGDQDSLAVFYRSAPSDAWHLLACYGSSTEDWQRDTLALPDPSGSYQIAFLGCNHDGYGVGLDRVVVQSDDACSSPAILTRTVTHNAITLSWSGTANGYEYAIKKERDNFFPMGSATSDNRASFSDLDAETRYVVRVRSLCGNAYASRWVYDTLLTHGVPCTAPDGLILLDSSYNTLTVDWNPTGQEQLWVVQLQSSRIGTIYDTVAHHPYIFENLETGDSYLFLVKALCDLESGDFSPWSDTLLCSPLDCLPVRDISLGAISDSYLSLSWTPGRDESSWLVEYGLPGFMQGLGIGTAVAETNDYRLSLAGLDPETDYELYVYARCTETATSIPAGPVAFHTGTVGISGFEGNADINIYPNPSSGSFTIAISSQITDHRSPINIDIVDMNGRTVRSTNLQILDATEVTFSGLPQGAYFVRIYGEEINSIRKLIVR